MWGQTRSAVQPSRVGFRFLSAVGQTIAQLLKRPEITIEMLVPILRNFAPEFFERRKSARVRRVRGMLSSEVRNELKSVETEIKYEGYLQQQQRAIERLKKSEQRSFRIGSTTVGERALARDAGNADASAAANPGASSRIPGVTPAAVSLVNVYIEIQARQREQAAAI